MKVVGLHVQHAGWRGQRPPIMGHGGCLAAIKSQYLELAFVVGFKQENKGVLVPKGIALLCKKQFIAKPQATVMM